MSTTTACSASLGGRTAWARNLAAPVRSFLSTETAGALAMLVAVLVALVWANADPASYASVWHTLLSVRVGSAGVGTDLRHWVNEGLMTLFFLVVGLEAKRELDLGELRERRRVAIPAAAALGGIAAPIAIYLAFNAGRAGGHGWGVAMSTDTAFALGALALLTPRSATRLRVFLLTLSVVDDLVALLVIATVYTTHVSLPALAAAFALFVLLIALRYIPVARSAASVVVAAALWVALFKSGIDPVVSGLAVGLVTSAYPPARADLEHATALARSFREQPTPELARSVQRGVSGAISANERMQYELHPWVSYAILPLFALANAGVHITASLLATAVHSPITLGIVVAYALGKPLGILAGSWVASRPALRGPRPLLSTPILAVGGVCAGIGFTVSLLIASLAFHGSLLAQAKLGALCTLILAPLLTATVLAAIRRLPDSLRARQLGRTAAAILDLADEVDPARDHIRGPHDAPVTVLEYGDFECTYCGQAEPVVRELLRSLGADVRYVWRHLPLNDVHPHAQLAAEAAEAAGAQGRFWEMHDALLDHGDALAPPDLGRYAEQLGLDAPRFRADLRDGAHTERVMRDVSSADESGVSGTPTFFINGTRHQGVYDIDTLTLAVRAAKRRAGLAVAAGA